ncbi:DUF3124 domain-containing protein, partial [Pirellulales bacterium]|nr:DUF3124 domain-containing protein [Pirellulales bacterium]
AQRTVVESEHIMAPNKSYPDWFLWIYEKGILWFIGGLVLLLAFILGTALYIDHRLAQVEDQLQFAPPRSFQTPDLEDYAPGDFDVDTLPVRQLVYVPVYSHVYYLGGAPYSLETTLSIRNIDPGQAVYLKSVEYFDTSGKLVKTYLDQTIRLGPLQTIEFLVERRDSSGGSGANFLVEWLADQQTNKPLVEAVMVGTAGSHGICFVRSGIEISASNSSAVD